jgi:Family of unknown function (DUF6610)
VGADVELIYCASKNKRFDDIALATGFRLGAQVPCTVYHPLWFCDQNWRQPDRAAYMAALATYRPHMASVLDLERKEQLSEVLSWAEEAARYCNSIMIIPKAHGIIQQLPRIIAGVPIILGYSVPTKHGGTPVWPSEFEGWPIHLLGGSPQAQMRHAARFKNVVSADGNMMNLMSTRFCSYWTPGVSTNPKDRYWQKMNRVECPIDAPLEAFRRSCENIKAAWRQP